MNKMCRKMPVIKAIKFNENRFVIKYS
uniref:Uncharacterized protein n=1 Tax=Ciona intestinalis TaxID=7719 RepID=H2XZW6_CIOIN